MKNNLFSEIINAIFKGKKIEIVWDEKEQSRDRIGRYAKQPKKVIFYSDLIREVSR